MARYPVNETSRQRLLEAQRAEAEALRAVDDARRARERVQVKVNRADAVLSRAKLDLVSVSGLGRAAVLTNVPPTELRRLMREAKATPVDSQ
ncbi:hypothetical protein V3N99_08600 [Dermatophilaceae bacterium Soc4.6]